jgi:hypothetical protein
MMDDPPLKPGVHDTVAAPLPGTAVGAVGAEGTVDGVAETEIGIERGPLPSPFVAATPKVYDTPFVRPVTVQENVAPLAVAQVPAMAPFGSNDVTE